MTIINQTNRTLLLEEINPEKLDLLTLIGDVKGIDSLSDDKIKEINQYLECRSYEEFQEKFAPCIYSFFDANTQSVRYTLKKPENIPVPGSPYRRRRESQRPPPSFRQVQKHQR